MAQYPINFLTHLYEVGYIRVRTRRQSAAELTHYLHRMLLFVS